MTWNRVVMGIMGSKSKWICDVCEAIEYTTVNCSEDSSESHFSGPPPRPEGWASFTLYIGHLAKPYTYGTACVKCLEEHKLQRSKLAGKIFKMKARSDESKDRKNVKALRGAGKTA